MARARTHTRCLPLFRVPYQALYRFNYSPLPSCLALWPASLTAEQACFYKAAVKRGESRHGRSWGLFRRRKILHRSVYSALWLGDLCCQCRRQTNGPLTARCPCIMVLEKKKKKFCRPLQCVGPPGKCPVCPITSPALLVRTRCPHKDSKAWDFWLCEDIWPVLTREINY